MPEHRALTAEAVAPRVEAVALTAVVVDVRASTVEADGKDATTRAPDSKDESGGPKMAVVVRIAVRVVAPAAAAAPMA